MMTMDDDLEDKNGNISKEVWQETSIKALKLKRW